MKEKEQLPDPKALSDLQRLETQFDQTLRDLRELLVGPDLPDRLAAAGATSDLFERLRGWQWQGPVLAPTVAGIEVTQSVQFFRPPVNIAAASGRTGPQPENDLPLVARKATVLRVYIENVASVSGTVEWRAVGATAWSSPVPALNAPLDPPVNPIASRGNSSASLNFRLPASECIGDLEVRLSFQGRAQSQESRLLRDFFGNLHIQRGVLQFWTTSTVFTLRFQAVNPLGIRLVRMRYEGRGLMLPAPSVADFWRTATKLRRMYPLSDICLWAESERLYDGNFSDITPGAQHLPGTPNGGTTGDWLHILNNMLILENAPDAVRYVMLYPNGAAASFYIGWGVGHTVLTPVDNQSALAHEIGHVCERQHAPCGLPLQDPTYPSYGNYGPASIGEFGVDVETLDIMNPAIHKDFMSYCQPTWIPPYQYEHIRNWLIANPGPTTCIQSSEASFAESEPIELAQDLRERLALTLQIYRNGRVRLSQPCFHLPMSPAADEGLMTDYFVELRNGEGDILSAIRLWLQDANFTLDDRLTPYLALIPWDAEATEVVILRGNDVLERFPIEAEAPRISEPYWEDAEGKTVRRLTWTSDTPATRFAVRYSPNGGDTWRAVEPWSERPSCEIDFDTLPGGDAAQVEIVASAGFRTTRLLVQLGAVSRKARVAQIIWPTESLVVRRGQTVKLLGQAISADGEALVDTLQWESDRDGPLGTGRELLLHTLSAGRHLITLSANDGLGGLTRATRQIDVQD